MKKRLLSLALCLALCLGLFPFSVLAEELDGDSTNAAKVGDTYYATLQDALDAAGENGDTVNLCRNIGNEEASILARSEKMVTLNLNGCAVNGRIIVGDVHEEEDDDYTETTITGSGNLTVMDSSNSGTGSIYRIDLYRGELNIVGGQIGQKGSSTSSGIFAGYDAGTINISGGTVYTLLTSNNMEDEENKLVTVNVTGGTGHSGSWKGSTLEGASINISGGSFDDICFGSANRANIRISGGTFAKIRTDNNVPLYNLLEDGYAFYLNNAVQNGTATSLTDVAVNSHNHTIENGACSECGVAFAASVTAGGQVRGYYATLKEAFAAANGAEGSTLTLLAEGQTGGSATATGNWTLDLNGHDIYSFSIGQAANEANGTKAIPGKLTITGSGTASSTDVINGTLTVSDNNVTIKGLSIASGGTAVLSGGNYTVGTTGASVKMDDNNKTVSELLAPGYAFQSTAEGGGIVDGYVQALTGPVKVVGHTHTVENGKCVCGLTCKHAKVDDSGKCENCGYQYAFRVDTGETRTFYDTFDNACSALSNSDGTITLLKDADTITLPDATFTLDLNGKTVTSMIATSDKPTLKATGGGTITSLKVQYIQPINLLERGFAFADSATKALVSGYVDKNIPSKTLNSITIVEHASHTYKEDGSCGCGYTCPHNSFDDNYKCKECDKQLVFQVNNSDDNSARYYVASKFSNALNDSSSNGTLKLLADTQISSDSREFSGKTFDLNGKDITCSDPLGSSYFLQFIGNSKLTTTGNSNIQRGYFCIGRANSNIGGSLIIDGPITFSMGFILYSGAKMTATNGVTFSYLKNYGTSIPLGSLLGTGYAFQNTQDTRFVEYNQILNSGASIEHIKAVLCTDHELNENNCCKWCNAGPYQAMINTTYYETLDAAIGAAKNGDTVKLLADAKTVTINKTGVKLDTNGKTIGKLTVSGEGLTLGSLLEKGYAFKSTAGDGTSSWVSDEATTATNVTVVQAPLTITEPEETEFSIPYHSTSEKISFTFTAQDGNVDDNNSIDIIFIVNGELQESYATGNNAIAYLTKKMYSYPVGTYTVSCKATYEGYTATSKSYTVHVVQSQTNFVVTIYNDSEIKNTFNYGDTVTIQGKVNATGMAAVVDTLSLLTDSEPTENYIKVYEGNTELGYSPAFTDNFGVATINTRDLGVGEHTLTVKYIGNANMASQETTATVTVTKVTPSIAWNGYPYGKSFSGEAIPSPTANDIQIVLNNTRVSLDTWNNVTFKWYEATKNTNGTYEKGQGLEGNPIDAGDYIIEATLAATDNTNEAVCEQGLTIGKKAINPNEPVVPATLNVYPIATARTYEIDLTDALKSVRHGGELAVNQYGIHYTGQVSSATIEDGKLKITMLPTNGIIPPANGVGSVNVGFSTRNYNQLPLSVTVNVIPKPEETLSVAMTGWTYGDTASTPEFTAPVGSTATVIAYTKDGTSVEKPTDAGNYTVTVKCETDDAIYTGSADFTIAPKDITGAKVTCSEFTYDGNEKIPEPTVELENQVLARTDYMLSYSPHNDAGTYPVTITGSGNYTGEIQAQWTIKRKAVTPNVTVENGVYNDGKAVEPNVTVKDGDTVLPVDEYNVVYNDNINAGTATVTITDKTGGNYAISEVSKNFVIAKANQVIAAGTVTATYGETGKKLTVNGAKTALSYSVPSDGEKVVAIAEDGTLTFHKAGTATIAVSAAATENYNASEAIQVTVTVNKAPVTIKAADKSVYVNGTAPDLSKPEAGKDYTVTGLIGGDTLSVAPALSYQKDGAEATPDMTKTGTYAIHVTVTGEDDRYDITPADGTLTITTRPSSGSSGSTGTKTDTVKNPDGSTTTTETKADGSKTETTKGTTDGGSTGSTVTKTDSQGNTTTEAEVKVSDKDAKNAQETGQAVTAPVSVAPGQDASTAPVVKIDLGSSAGKGEVKVEIPVQDVSSGTVAVIVHPDGTEEIMKDSVPTDKGLEITLRETTTVKILDNSKTFDDTKDHWSRDEVNFVAARELFQGVGGNRFGVSEAMTRGMVNTVLARLNGVDTTPGQGQTWYEIGTDWAMKHGITDGTNPTANVTREQLATLLYRYAGSPAVSGTLTFADAASVSDYAKDALLWANQNGIVNGVGSNTIAPKANAERAQVAAMFARYLQNQ